MTTTKPTEPVTRPGQRDGGEADESQQYLTPADLAAQQGSGIRGKADSGLGATDQSRAELRRDAALMRRAIREGWPISRRVRRRIPDVLAAAAESDPALAAPCARALVAMDEVNIRALEATDRARGGSQVNVQINVGDWRGALQRVKGLAADVSEPG